MRPIGVFDSGLGGLTVVHALERALPDEALLYLGDTARVPYGSKSAETVLRYSRRSAAFLLDRDIKLLLIACNTASAYALDALAAECPVPVLGAVEPGARAAVAATRTGRVGVIGTLGTVRSGSYTRAIGKLDGGVHVTALACPLFVPLVEEGWLGGDAKGGGAAELERTAARAIAERYLTELRDMDPHLDVLVLGCTHYPLLRGLLSEVAPRVFGREVALVDSAQAMARAAADLCASRGLKSQGPGGLSCFITDETRFAELGARFLGHPIGHVERVDL